MSDVVARYTTGTHRTCTPAETLARIGPLLPLCGITRCADVTRLELDLGVPTCCAIRPGGSILATSNGKGLTKENASVSALMEAVELFHSEQPDEDRFRRASLAEMDQNRLHPADLPEFEGGYCSDTFRFDWVEGEELGSARRVWAPASSVYADREPSLHRGTTNGLASGNHLIEASLHALYELIERDAVSGLVEDGKLQLKSRCLDLDPASIPDEALRRVLATIEASKSKLVLFWVPSAVPIHTFWAFLVNLDAVASPSTVNPGSGTHCDAVVAATRAITEAVQTRLTSIHGAREDFLSKYSRPTHIRDSRTFRYFAEMTPTRTWRDIPTVAPADTDLVRVFESLVGDLGRAGHPVYRFDLTKKAIGIPVVKVIAPTFRFERRLF